MTLTLAAAVTATDTDGQGELCGAQPRATTNKLADAAGNTAADFTDSAVTNATGPALTALAVSSSAGTDSTYAIGDTIALKATFNVAVTVNTSDGTPRIPFTLGTATKHAAYHSGSTTKELVFHYTVTEGDADSDGIAVAAERAGAQRRGDCRRVLERGDARPRGGDGEHGRTRSTGCARRCQERGGFGRHDADPHLRRVARRGGELPRELGRSR